MPGLIDDDTGLMYGVGLVWLLGGIGEPGLSNPVILPETVMITEAGDTMITEADDTMWTE